MADAAQPASGTNKPFLASPKAFAPEDEAALREALKRCSPSTFESASQFRKTGNPEHLPAVVIGVIERFVEPDLRIKLKDAVEARAMVAHLRDNHGLLSVAAGENVVRILPPLVIDESHIAECVERLSEGARSFAPPSDD